MDTKLEAQVALGRAMSKHVHVAQCHRCGTIRLADVECQECNRTNEQVIAPITGQPIEIDAAVIGVEFDPYKDEQKTMATEALEALERGDLQTVDIAVAKLLGWYIEYDSQPVLYPPHNGDHGRLTYPTFYVFDSWERCWDDVLPHYATDLNAAAKLPLPLAHWGDTHTNAHYSVVQICTFGKRDSEDGISTEYRKEVSECISKHDGESVSDSEAQARTGAWLKMVKSIGFASGDG